MAIQTVVDGFGNKDITITITNESDLRLLFERVVWDICGLCPESMLGGLKRFNDWYVLMKDEIADRGFVNVTVSKSKSRSFSSYYSVSF